MVAEYSLLQNTCNITYIVIIRMSTAPDQKDIAIYIANIYLVLYFGCYVCCIKYQQVVNIWFEGPNWDFIYFIKFFMLLLLKLVSRFLCSNFGSRKLLLDRLYMQYGCANLKVYWN